MPKPLIKIERAGAIESLHFGFWAFLDGKASSEKVYEELVCLRSVSKPFQTLACLRLGLNLNLKQIAIATSSHSGTDEHIALVEEILQNFKIDWQFLNCGEHPPFSRSTAQAEEFSKKRRLQNNCSGKHSMLLAVCKLKNWDLASYQQIEHELQKEILQTISDLCEVNNFEIGLDGCGLPTYSLKVKDLLKGFSKFQINSPDKLIAQISLAMLEESFYISGSKRLDHEITKAVKPNLICKSGAGGLMLVSLQNQQNALLIKLHDADEKAKALILKRLLYDIGLGFESDFSLFEEKITNLLGLEAAKIVYTF